MSSSSHAAAMKNDLDCNYGVQCHSECELRHLDEYEQQVRRGTRETTTQLIICAGSERSGSTWLYNAVRHLHSGAAQVPCDSYWIHRLTESKIQHRLQQQGRVVVVKTHKFYSDYDDWLFRKFNPTILLTHRDLRQVLASYVRVGWASDIPNSYVEHHMKWLQHANLDLSYEEIVSDPQGSLAKIASTVGLGAVQKDEIQLVERRVKSLKSPVGMVDQVTKMWPLHRGTESIRDKHEFDELLERFPEYAEMYGYK